MSKWTFIKVLLVSLICLVVGACQPISEETKAKIHYWNKQVEIMLLVGPQKEHVFAWVYAIDPNAKYSGDNLVANVETIKTEEEVFCIVLNIEFDQADKARKHTVDYGSCA